MPTYDLTRHRHRSRRLCLRHPRGTARHEGRSGREGQDLRRHLPQYRVHSVESAAPCLGIVRRGGPRLRQNGNRRRQAGARSCRHAEVQGRGRRRQRQGRRLSLQEEQDRPLYRRRPHRRAGQDRGHGRRRRGDHDRHQGDGDRHRLRHRAPQGHRPSTRSASFRRPVRCCSNRCRASSSWSVPA